MIELLLHLSTAFGLSSSAGLNAYIPLLAISLLSYSDELGGPKLIQLNPPWDYLAHPAAIAVLVILLVIEILADKIPAVNHANDVVQTIVRPAAGVVAFAASTGAIGVDPVIAVICGLILAGSVHAVKSVVVRPAVTATTAGVANPIVSAAEDVVAGIVSLLAIVLPWVIALLVVMILGLIVWLLARRASPAPTRP